MVSAKPSLTPTVNRVRSNMPIIKLDGKALRFTAESSISGLYSIIALGLG
jgi:hypothetical protein